MLYPARRIVTGHDQKGRSIVLSDGIATNTVSNPASPNRGLTNFWRTDQTPASNEGNADPMAGPRQGLVPPKGGSVFRFFQIAPEKEESHMTPEQKEARMRAAFAQMGAAGNRVDTQKHSSMHKTETVDYIILLKGEVTLLLDVGEVPMKPFDVVVQRGTNHGWVNRGTEPALFAAVLIDAKPL
jgi:naringenin degradation protein FdeH